MLLKRLAVAYADPTRRQASADELPNLDVTPVLIRCREWREHIHLPILSILRLLPDITGDARLSGLGDALLPLFAKGKALLLVDGLDEIHNDAHRTTFIEHLESFMDEYPQTRLIVTSREAGFSLLAPTIARFCGQWRIAPLSVEAVHLLCDHWQRVMAGDTPHALEEGKEMAFQFTGNPSLSRLAENPLLLTMLLVVKHGAGGRLPPDRVSLYARAVEVLLDTWNIKGHAPLNPKEAVPQLAYVAFEMMRRGKQTATEKELLALVEDARTSVPQIRRYSKDAPHEFLKRVELRSSLLLEAGHQVESHLPVPFYQFRHLTFQEYLAAVAAAEGHYAEYSKEDTVLTPLQKYLLMEEWKEVIPMAAVLARKQAEPIMVALVADANRVRLRVEAGTMEMEQDSEKMTSRMPSAAARLIQCLGEEAEASPETLGAALQATAFFAARYAVDDKWDALGTGPYGSELLHQMWLVYETVCGTQGANPMRLLASYSRLADVRQAWAKDAPDLSSLLRSEKREDVVTGLLACWGRGAARRQVFTVIDDFFEKLNSEDPVIQLPAVYSIAHMWHLTSETRHVDCAPTPQILDRLLSLRLYSLIQSVREWSSIAFAGIVDLMRSAWLPALSQQEAQEILRSPVREDSAQFNPYLVSGNLRIAFHAVTVMPDPKLVEQLAKSASQLPPQLWKPIIDMLEQLGDAGRKQIRRLQLKERARYKNSVAKP